MQGDAHGACHGTNEVDAAMIIKFKSTVAALALHVAVALACVLAGVIGGCRFKKQKVEIVDFTIAVDPAVEEPEVVQPKPPEVKPPEPPPQKDDIAQPKPKPPEPKPKPKPPEPKPKPKPKPIEKGKRINKTTVKSTVTPKEKQTLTDAEIEKWLAKRARIGEKTSLPKNEQSMNVSILMNSFYEAWQPPSRESSGYRPATLVFGISKDGTLTNPRVVASSGSVVYDNSCLEAIRRVGRVRGLSAKFIDEYGASCEFEFKQKD